MIDRLRDNRTLLGIVCIVLGMTCISVQDATVKWISGDYTLHQVMLIRAMIALPLTLVILRFEGGFAALRTPHLPLLLVRAMLTVMANLTFFLGLSTMQLAEATTILYAAPLFITALSAPLLGERVGPRRWFAVLAGMAGVVVMFRPGAGAINLVALLPLMAAMLYAGMALITRKVGMRAPASVMSFYIQVTFIVVSGGFGILIGDGRLAATSHPSLEFLLRAWVWPAMSDLPVFLMIGVVSTAIGYLLAQAYRLAPVATVAPFEYTAVPLAVIWGLLLWGDVPDGRTFLGIALIVGGGLFVLYRESRRGRVRRPVGPGLGADPPVEHDTDRRDRAS